MPVIEPKGLLNINYNTWLPNSTYNSLMPSIKIYLLPTTCWVLGYALEKFRWKAYFYLPAVWNQLIWGWGTMEKEMSWGSVTKKTTDEEKKLMSRKQVLNSARDWCEQNGWCRT